MMVELEPQEPCECVTEEREYAKVPGAPFKLEAAAEASTREIPKLILRVELQSIAL